MGIYWIFNQHCTSTMLVVYANEQCQTIFYFACTKQNLFKMHYLENVQNIL